MCISSEMSTNHSLFSSGTSSLNRTLLLCRTSFSDADHEDGKELNGQAALAASNNVDDLDDLGNSDATDAGDYHYNHFLSSVFC